MSAAVGLGAVVERADEVKPERSWFHVPSLKPAGMCLDGGAHVSPKSRTQSRRAEAGQREGGCTAAGERRDAGRAAREVAKMPKTRPQGGEMRGSLRSWDRAGGESLLLTR